MKPTWITDFDFYKSSNQVCRHSLSLEHLSTDGPFFVIEHEDDLDTCTIDFHQSSNHGLSPLNSVLEAAKSGQAGHPDAMD